MASKKYTIDFEIGNGLKTAVKNLKEFSNTAGNVELSPDAIKQINDVTDKVEELSKEIKKVGKEKVDLKEFKSFSDTVKGYVEDINKAVTLLQTAFNNLGDIPGLKEAEQTLQSIRDMGNSAVNSINKTIETAQKVSKIKTPQVDTQTAKQAQEAEKVLETTRKTTRAKKEELEVTRKENKELQKKADIERDLKPKSIKRESKKVNTELKKEKAKVEETLAEFSDEKGNEVDISVVIPKGTDAILKQRINEIVNAINETNPTITVGVRFASDYNTRQRREAIEQLQKNVNEKLDSIDVLPNTKKAKEQYAQTIEDIRGMLLKELRHDDTDAMFQFSTNVAQVGQQVIDTVKSVSEALGELPLHADLIFNEEKIQADLHKMKDLSLEITSLDFSKSFLDSLDATKAITQIQGEIDKIHGPEPAQKTDEENKLEDLLEKVKKVRTLASSIGKDLQPIKLTGAFDKDQLQDALNNIAGLILKIDELDVGHIKGTKLSGEMAAGNIIANGTLSGIVGGVNPVVINQEVISSEDDKKEAVEKSTDANVEATESLKKLTPEMENFIEKTDKLAKKLVFKSDGTLSQTGADRGKIQDLLRTLQKSPFGLVDWAMNTKALGTGDAFNSNLKVLEGMQASMAHDSKVPHPKVLVYDENFFKQKQGGGLTKKGNEKALETLFSSMRLYGANKDAEHTASEMIRNIKNSKTRQDVLDLFYQQNPNYKFLRSENININTPSPEKRQSYKKVLSKEVEENSKVTKDILDDLNRDIIQYLGVTDDSLESVDKVLNERLEDLQKEDKLNNTEEGRRFKALSPEFFEDEHRKDLEIQNELGKDIFAKITSLSPEKLNSIDTEKYPQLARFVSTLQEKYPERWANLNKIRNQKVDEELTRRFKAIGMIDDRILESEENDAAVEKFIDKFFEAYPNLDGEGFKDKLSEKTNNTLLDSASFKRLEKSYKERKDTDRLNAMPLEQRLKTLIGRIRLDDKGEVKQTEASAKNIENIFNTLLNDQIIGMDSGLEEAIQKYNIPASIGNALKERQENLNKELQEGIDKKLAEAKENAKRSQARVKTDEEKRKETVAKQKQQSVQRKVEREERKEVTRREGYDDFFSSAQELTQKVTTRVSVDNLSQNNTVDIQKMLQKYYERLAQIELLKEKINDYKKRIKETTGEELSDEQVFQEIFPASPENVKSALSGLKKYDEYIAEAKKLINRINDINDATKQYEAEQKKAEAPVVTPLEFTETDAKSLNKILNGLTVNESGAIEDTKENQALLEKFSQEVHKILQGIQEEEIKSQTQQLQKQADEISAQLEGVDIKALEQEKRSIEDEQARLETKIEESRNKIKPLENQLISVTSKLNSLSKDADKTEKKQLEAEKQRVNRELLLARAKGENDEKRYDSLTRRKAQVNSQLSLISQQEKINQQLQSQGKSSVYVTQESLKSFDVPGIEKFNTKISELRAVGRGLGEEFDKLSLQMKTVGEGTEEYVALENKRNEVNQKINDNAKQLEQVATARGQYADAFHSALEGRYYDQMKDVGEYAPQGYIEGVKEEEQDVKLAVEEVIKAGIEAAKEAQDSHSPSRVYYQLGNWAIDGYVNAIKENLPVIKEFASQIKFNPDGTMDMSAGNVALANKLIETLKQQWGAVRVSRVSPFDDWKDNKGLKTLLEELPKTAKTGQIKKSDVETFRPFFEKFIDSYGIDVQNGKTNMATFDAVMKEMGVGDKDLSILKERFYTYMQQRAKEIANERANIKAIADGLTKNSDNTTINKRMNINGDKFRELYKGYVSSYKGAITGKGINDETFNKFASDMGLSEENAQRVRDVFNKLFDEMRAHIDEVRQECNDAAHGIFHETEEEIKDSSNLESKAIAENKDEALKTVKEEAEAKEKADKQEAKRREQLISDLEKIQKDTTTYMTPYREKVGETITKLRNGGSLAEGEDVLDAKKQTSNKIAKKAEARYYDIVGGVNRLLSNKDIGGGLRQEVEDLSDALKQLDPQAEISQKDIENLNSELRRLQSEADKAGKTFFNTVVERLRKANADFIARYLSIRDLIRYFREFMQTVTELDTALTEMRKVSDESLASLKEYQKATFDIASALGTTAVQVQQSTADWMRLGETMEEAAKSAQASTTLLNVSEFENINDATTALVAMSQAYKDLDKTEIIDVLNNIGNNYSIATDQLATALQASSAALMTQGNDLYEAAALVTAGNAIIQDASKTGTGIRTIALRIAGQKLGKEELEQELNELGEEVDEWVMQTESKKRQAIMEYTRVAANDYQGVDILDANGNLKDTYHILLEISQVYKDIQEEDKKLGTNRAQGLVEELAGKVRSNIAASILMNPQMLEDVYNDALNSMGSAAEENAKYLDSIAGKTQQLKNEWQEFQFNMLDSEFLKNMIDLLKGLLKVVNSLGDSLPVATTALSAFAFAILSVSKGLFVLKGGQLGAIPKFFASMVSAIKMFTGAEVMAEEAILATNVALGVQNFLMGAAFVAVLAAAAYGVYKLATHEKELAKAAQEARDSINQTRDSLKQTEKTVDDVGQRYAELAQKVKDVGKATQSQGSLSSDEYKEFLDISNQLAEVFPRLTEGYDANGNALLALDGNVNQITESLEALLEEEKKFADEEILKNAETVYAQQIKEYREKRNNISAMNKENKQIANKTNYVMSDILSQTTVSRGDSIFDISYEKEIRETLKKALGNQEGLKAYLKVLSTQNVFNEDTGRYETTSTYDFSQLTEEEIKAIQNYYDDIVLANKKEISNAEREIDQTNKEFSQWMVLSLKDSAQYGNLSKEKQQILESIVGDLDFDKIDDADKSDWDSLTAYIENNFVSAIADLDNKKLEDLLYSKLADTTLDPVEKSEIIEQILELLTEIDGVTEEHPLYLHFQAAYDDVERQTNEAVQHILDGMVVGADDTEAILEQRAKDWIRQLDANQLEALMNQPIPANTLSSYEDLLNLLKQINQETSHYESIGQLLSQDNYVDDSVKKARERYNEEWKEANSKGTQFNQTTYGNVDLNNRGVLEWDETNIKKYTKAIESWGASVEDYAGSISTVDAMWEKFDGVDIAFTPILQTPNGPEYLDSETVYKYINTLMSQLPEGWNDEDLFKLDAQGIEVNGKKIKGLIAGIGDEAKRVSETMHYLGKDGSLALSEKELQTAKEAAITWGDVRADLVGMAQSGKLDENTLRQYKYFNEIIKALGSSANVTDDELKTMIDEINRMAQGGSVDKLSNAKTNLDKLDSAYKKFQSKEFVDSSSLNEVQDTFAYLGEAYRDFEDAVKRGENDLQPYFDNIATQYAIQEGLLEDLTEASEEWTVQQLVNAGITEKSAREGVALALKQKQMLEGTLLGQIRQINTVATLDEETQQYIATVTDLNSLDAKTISDLIREAMATGKLSGKLQTAAQNVALYAAQKALAQGADLRNSDDFDYLIELIKATGVATEAVERLEQAKARSAQNTAALDKAQADYNNFATKMNGKYGANWQNKLDYSERNSLNAYSYNLNSAISNVNINDSNIESLIGEVSDAVEDAWKKQDPNLGIKFNYGGAVESAEAGGKEAAEAFKDALDKILAMYDAELDAGVITFQTYVDKSRQAIEQYYNEGKIKASEYYDYLANLYQKQVSEYDKVISAVQRLLKKQTDELQKQKEAIEESYNLQIEEIQKKIDALRDENDEIDKNMALQKAQ